MDAGLSKLASMWDGEGDKTLRFGTFSVVKVIIISLDAVGSCVIPAVQPMVVVITVINPTVVEASVVNPTDVKASDEVDELEGHEVEDEMVDGPKVVGMVVRTRTEVEGIAV